MPGFVPQHTIAANATAKLATDFLTSGISQIDVQKGHPGISDVEAVLVKECEVVD